MKFFISVLKDFPSYLWSGWSSLAAVFLFFALWDVGFQLYGELILPSPATTLKSLYLLLQQAEIQHNFFLTLQRVLLGFGISLVVGSVLGLLAGLSATASVLSRPLVSIFTGMPPIAWIVLAMIWFGFGNATVIFTVVVASFPIMFVGALQGTRTLEGDLQEMADSFSFGFWLKLREVYAPHLFSYFFPSWIAALGMSWKIVVMAELLSSNDGMGANLAIAQSQLDTPVALALVMLLVATLILFEYGVLEPIRKEVEAWRD